MKIEIAIPCYNEEKTIYKVVTDFKKVLPEAEVIVYNNNSCDASKEEAEKAGAKVINVITRGKGLVVKEIFERFKGDILVIVDGDDTYEAKDIKVLIEPIINCEADMVVGTRLHCSSKEFRYAHYWGNLFITRLVNFIFGVNLKDVLSGYRAFSKKFTERIPLISQGFEIETELTLQALENNLVIKEVPISFRQRPQGSKSKLNTLTDGYKVVLTIIAILRDYHPLFSFTILSMIGSILAIFLWILKLTFLRYIAIIIGFFSLGLFFVGLVLNTVDVKIRQLQSLLYRQKYAR